MAYKSKMQRKRDLAEFRAHFQRGGRGLLPTKKYPKGQEHAHAPSKYANKLDRRRQRYLRRMERKSDIVVRLNELRVGTGRRKR